MVGSERCVMDPPKNKTFLQRRKFQEANGGSSEEKMEDPPQKQKILDQNSNFQ